MKPSIVFLDTDTIGSISNLGVLATLGNTTFYPYTLPHQTKERCARAEIIITNKVIISQEIIDACPELQLICIAATGTNNVDVTYAESKGIAVKNAVGYSTNSVAQHTFAVLLEMMHNTRYYDSYVKSGAYSQQPIFTHLGKSFEELNGKKFGIIGLGNIGRKVAEIATVFGASVCYFSTSGIKRDEKYPAVSLEKLLTESDIISIHAPLNPQTKGLIGYDQLKIIKPTAYLLNMGRGGIVSEKDVFKILEERHLAGVSLDVFEKEPLDLQNPLLYRAQPRLLLTPHIAWSSLQARQKLIDIIIEHIHSA